MTELPQSADAVSAEWLSRALDEPVESVRAESVGPLEGVNSEVSRLHLELPGGEMRTVIFKVPAASEGARGVAAYQGWYEREVGFYREFASDAPIGLPGVQYAQIEPDGRYVLVLDDIGGVPQGDQVAGCTPEVAHSAVIAAARLHARFWQHDALDRHDWLPATTVGLERAGPVAGAFARSWSLRRERTPEALRLHLDAAVEAYPDLLALAASPPVTLIHGDYRLDNVFVRPDGSDLTVIDWQFICRCRGPYDVGYFLGLDLELETRRTHEGELLEAYRTELGAAGVQYEADAVERDYRLGLLLGYAVFTIGAAGQDPATRAGEMHEVGLERLGAAIVDHGGLEGLL